MHQELFEQHERLRRSIPVDAYLDAALSKILAALLRLPVAEAVRVEQPCAR